jgi:UDP-N-acetylglucosamine transferase subunit ALG13
MKKRLLVASTGGHLTELVVLAPRLRPLSSERHWVTFDTPQSRHLLAGERVTYVRNTPPRDLRGVLVNLQSARRIFRTWNPDEVVSNGAGIALSFIPLARATGLPAHYIECSARTEGPSLTGRVLMRVPGVTRYTQDPAWARAGWRHSGSIFDGFRPSAQGAQRSVRRVFVTVGSLDFSYMRLFDRLQSIIPDGLEVIVQAGRDSDRLDWNRATVVQSLPPDETEAQMEAADVVVAHAGIGSAIDALRAGKAPVLVPRRHRYDEHVDDHQLQIASRLEARALAVTVDAAELEFAHLELAAKTSVVPDRQSVFQLTPG